MKSAPFSTEITDNGEIVLKQQYPIKFIHGKFTERATYVKSGVRIATASFVQEKSFVGSEKEIIKQIHKERFDPNNLYVITGGHFHQLYVRNLGIFYNALLDGRFAFDKRDWENRQRIALQTVALDLEVFKQAKKTYTTIVPLTKKTYTAMNIRTTPSDSLFGIFFALNALVDENYIPAIFPTKAKQLFPLQTITAGKQLIATYKTTLQKLLRDYKQSLVDEKTGLIKTSIHLASSFDGVKRESSFFDNVILWATYRLARRLGIITLSEKERELWKQRIITAFWDKEIGIFLDDLSAFSKSSQLFSADCLIAISTQFLDTTNPKERAMLISIMQYIQHNKIDQPFPLRFTQENHKHRMYPTIRYFTPEYMGDGIWSHWGMEYIKLLILLSKYNSAYQEQAKKYLDMYKNNIEHYGGYPELYHTHGAIYKKAVYKGVLHNGWVVGYEQAKMMAALRL